MMMVRMQVDVLIDEDVDMDRLRRYLGEGRQMMVDPGGEEKGFVGTFAGATQVYGVSV